MTSEGIASPSFIISSLSLVVSSVVLAFTILNFRRQKTLDNQNHIFKTKIEDYKAILKEITVVFNLFPTESELREIAGHDDKIEEMATKIDEAVIHLSFFVIPHSIILPTAVLQSIEELVNFLSDSDSGNENHKDLLAAYDQAYIKANRILTMIRQDLKSDDLNYKLFTRLK
jgi:hypothetical protein